MPRDLKEAMLFIWFYNGFFSRAIGQRTGRSFFERLSQALAKDWGASLLVERYLGAWGTNFVMAVSLNFLLLGPFSRCILGCIQKLFSSEERIGNFEDDDELSKII